MAELRTKIKQIIFTITLAIIAILILRLLLDLLGLTNKNAFFLFLKSLSDIFIGPFQGIIAQDINRDLVFFNFDVFISIGFYILLGVMLAELCTFFLYDNFKLVLIHFFDIVFKLIESLFILRIILDVFLVKTGTSIVKIILDLTNWTHGVTNINFFDGRIYLGTFLVLVVVVVFDYLVDAVLRALPGSNEEQVAVKTVTTQYRPQNRL